MQDMILRGTGHHRVPRKFSGHTARVQSRMWLVTSTIFELLITSKTCMLVCEGVLRVCHRVVLRSGTERGILHPQERLSFGTATSEQSCLR